VLIACSGSARLSAALLAFTTALPVYADIEVVGKDGCVVEAAFDAHWRKFSDFDITAAPQSRSVEVQGYQAAQDELRAIDQDIASIAAHMELDRVARLAARDLEQALRQGLKVNLLKAFWRLAWITYNTIGGPTGKTEMIKAGRSYAELFSENISVASTAKMLGVVKKLVPKQYSKLPGNEGRVVNVGVDAVLETLKNSEKSRTELVAAVVTKVLDTGSKEALEANAMKADITPEEVAILRTQYIDQKKLKNAIDESYRLNGERSKRLEALEVQAKAARDKAAEWETKEKRRVFTQLNERCRGKLSMQFGLSAPPRVVAGDVVEIRALLPPGRKQEDLYFAWMVDGQGSLSGSLLQHFQSARTGPHTVSVGFYEKGPEGAHLGNLSAEIQVVEPPPVVSTPATGAGPIRVKISSLVVKPAVIKPGDVVELNVTYSVSGVPRDKTVPVTLSYSGGSGDRQLFKQITEGAVGSGTFTGWHQLPTARWKPGRYAVQVSASAAGQTDSAAGSFIVRKPEVTLARPPVPAAAAGPATTKARDFVGDWEGTGTVIRAQGQAGWRVGDRMPMKVRITREAGAYRVYDLNEPDTPTAPMQSKVVGNSVVFFYQGPAVDTQGYEHPDTPIDASWTLTLQGNNVGGDFSFSMDDLSVTINVQATRAR
jgi:hypothetical protein